jgi:hypothetical protein
MEESWFIPLWLNLEASWFAVKSTDRGQGRAPRAVMGTLGGRLTVPGRFRVM